MPGATYSNQPQQWSTVDLNKNIETIETMLPQAHSADEREALTLAVNTLRTPGIINFCQQQQQQQQSQVPQSLGATAGAGGGSTGGGTARAAQENVGQNQNPGSGTQSRS